MVAHVDVPSGADGADRLTPFQRLLYDQLPAVCKQTAQQRLELADWLFHQPHLFCAGGDEGGIQLATGAESVLLLQQIAGHYPALAQQVTQLQQQLGRRAEAVNAPATPKAEEFARLVTHELRLKEQVQAAIEQVVTQTAEQGLHTMVSQVHRRMEEATSPALVTARRYHRLQMVLWGLVCGGAILLGLLVLAYHKAAYFREGFYKYELVRYRALLPGHSGYRPVFEEVEGAFNQPHFLDKLAGMEALYSRLGTTATSPPQPATGKAPKRTPRPAE